jgi:hypothetical protein
MNLVSTVMQFLTPMITNRIAASLGINNTLATTAIGAIVPAILAGLAGKAATPAGASVLTGALGKMDPNILGSLGGMIGGAGQADMVKMGGSVLSDLLGGSATSALAGAVGKFTGIGGSQTTSLIGMLAPMVLGSLAQTQKASGLDAGGLASLLASQKGNIAAAMPPGFSQLLGGSGLLDGIAGNLPAAPKVETPKMPSKPVMAAAPAFNWMPWAAGAAVLLGLFYVLGGPATKPVEVPKAAAPVATTVAGLDDAKKIISSLTSTLGTIKDGPTAKAALPQLTTQSTALDGLIKLYNGLPPEAKAQIASVMAAALPQIKPLLEAAMKIPGVEGMLKPVLDVILAKMTGLSKV